MSSGERAAGRDSMGDNIKCERREGKNGAILYCNLFLWRRSPPQLEANA